jgi:phosphoserine phosphatase
VQKEYDDPVPRSNPRKWDDEGVTKRAAFFDLDRTLLGDSSGFLIMDALAEKGLISERQQSLAQVGRRIFRVLGETRVGMELTRRSMSRLAGWTRRDLREAAER